MDWRSALKSLIDDTKAHVKALEALQPSPAQAAVTARATNPTKETVAPLVVKSAIPKPSGPPEAFVETASHTGAPQQTTASAPLVPIDDAGTISVHAPGGRTFLESERADIEQRVAEFKALQARMQQEREDYYAETLARARKLP